MKSGLERARAQDKRLGRRPIDARKEAAIRADLREGKAGIMKLAALRNDRIDAPCRLTDLSTASVSAPMSINSSCLR